MVFSAEIQVIILFITTGLLLAGVGQLLRNSRFDKVQKGFRVLARYFGWEVYPKGGNLAGLYTQVPGIKGQYRGKQCKVQVYTQGNGTRRAYFTSFKIRVQNPQKRSVTILREDFYQKVSKWIGKEDIIIGDPNVDNFFIFRADDPRFLKTLITDDLKDQLKKNHVALNGTLKLEDHEWSYTEKTLITRPFDIRRFAYLINLVLCMAASLEHYEKRYPYAPDEAHESVAGNFAPGSEN